MSKRIVVWSMGLCFWAAVAQAESVVVQVPHAEGLRDRTLTWVVDGQQQVWVSLSGTYVARPMNSVPYQKRVRVPGVTYDAVKQEILARQAGQSVVCATTRRTSSLLGPRVVAEPTGACLFQAEPRTVARVNWDAQNVKM